MKKKTKLVALLMAMVLVMGPATACGSDDSSSSDGNTTNEGNTTADQTTEEGGATAENPIDVELTVWTPQEDQADYSNVDEKYGDRLIKYMCNQFNEEHPEWNITFKYAVCPESDAYKELSKDAAAGADVFMYAGDQAISLVNNGIALPLLGLDDVKANNGEKAMNAVTMKDPKTGDVGTYGVPFTPNTWFMYYDSSKYSEEEVKSLDTMMAKDIKGCDYNFSMDLDNGWYNAGFFYSNGCTVFGADGTNEEVCDFNSDKGLAAATAMLELAQNKKFLCDDDAKAALSHMKKGNCAALTSGTWDAGNVKKVLKKNYAAAKLPTVTIGGQEVQLNSIGDYKYVGVNATTPTNTEHPEVAQALAIYLGGEQCQLDHFLARGVSPTWASLAENPDVAADVATTALAEQNQYTAITPTSEKFQNNFWPAMEALGKGMINGETNADNLQAKLDGTVENIVTELAK